MEQKEITFPNYEHSILNLISSVLTNYNVKTNHSTLPVLDNILKKDYQNIILLVLDGMGNDVLNYASANGFFSQNKVDIITSVYPSTTAAALTTYYSGKAPIETGFVAYSQYYKEYGRAIDMLSLTDSYTGEEIKSTKSDIHELVKYTTIYDQILEASPNTKIYEIKPLHCDKRTDVCLHTNTIEGLCQSLISLCKNKEKKFIFAYNDNPDKTLHRNGCYSEKVKNFIVETEEKIQSTCQELKNTNTLFLISADHGHIDIKETNSILDLKELQSFFIMPPSFEARCLTFFIKSGKEEEFKKVFNSLFQDKFLLFSKEEFKNKHLLGFGKEHFKIDDLLGDFIAMAISDASIKLETNISKEKYQKLSNHAGLTTEEMEVPLIAIDLK